MSKKTVSVNVDVDVDLSDFDTDDLIAEIDERGVNGFEPYLDRMQRLYELLSSGRDDEAMSETRAMVCDAIGRVL